MKEEGEKIKRFYNRIIGKKKKKKNRLFYFIFKRINDKRNEVANIEESCVQTEDHRSHRLTRFKTALPHNVSQLGLKLSPLIKINGRSCY